MSTDGPAMATDQLSIPTEAERPGVPVGDRELQALGRHGFGVAYRMLGSVADAEDVAQEALLRLTRQNDPIDEPAAWMTTVPTRLSINVRKSARVRLTIRGVTRTVTGNGHYASPRPASFGEVAGLQLRTSFDRREFGFDWQMELPGGGDAVGWEVEVDIDLLLIRADAG